ncbi:hypothetical protein MCOR27_007517 [Pyricularia oryzae]|uniref:FAD synthase n=5 Tax=Pyricularia TaxID=48558 RepID=A0ABQ8P1B9_PYRGI|nr:FAD synthetase [Pyricularia oryzae 70-15]ELQ39611.1 FAD synthetase [Pyricularia oryzae Y34]KAH8839402.1 hypothetical protein MCOR01_008605 [Pyricularia oryzae]KAI6303999.1 hypothetical protein MCOR33_000979 [Pyricularia grisea]EHA55194.1 FAD synthetase [Pyricularia oryzae 70-15]KAH9439253.1 hypothetical protein MCOR02_002819 [Pyricularia oryzae]
MPESLVEPLHDNKSQPLTNGAANAASDAPAQRSLRDVCNDAQRKVAAFLSEPDPGSEILRAVQRQVRISLDVVDKALEEYGIPELSLSYNGGKDCLVMLILILACLPRHFDSSNTPPPTTEPATTTTPIKAIPQPPRLSAPSPPRQFPDSLQAVYVVSRHPFAEVDAFVDRTSAEYHLAVERIAQPMKPALHAYLAARPAVRAVFVGTRRTDPHGESLTHFDATDPGWPPFMRVHPVIDWHYAEIWAFIRRLGIPYCELYDRGYTSLGGTTDTNPNPALKRVVEDTASGKADSQETFRPAYELMDDYEERLGRDR